MLVQFCFLTDEKIFTVVTLKIANNHQLYAIAACNQEGRHDKTLADTVNVQTVTEGISRRVTSG